MRCFTCALLLTALCAAGPARAQSGLEPSGDLDAFMAQVLTRRDENWKKLQQYILDERERFELRGPERTPIWGGVRDYTWYIRDGYFVRSPVRADGAAVGEADRQKYEEDFLRRERRREARRQRRQEEADAGAEAEAESSEAVPTDAQGLVRQSREPLFVSSAYFLRFQFEPGRYALVGRETFAGREVLRVEYYPTLLFSDRENRREQPRSRAAGGESDDDLQDEVRRVMNKVSLVTLWIEPDLHQIVKYTFENVGLDFLPTAWTWLLRVADVQATMVMGEAFSDVWLPESLDLSGAMVLAPGRFDISYGVRYFDYRQAEVTSTIRTETER
jgi:hypothetical protein